MKSAFSAAIILLGAVVWTTHAASPWSSTCRTDSRTGTQVCYQFFGEMSWRDARYKCHNVGGVVATISDVNEASWIDARITTNMWVGPAMPDENEYLWAKKEKEVFSAWVSDNEPGGRRSEQCADFEPIGSRKDIWSDWSCGNRIGYTCKKELGAKAACDSGWKKWGTYCYQFNNDRKNWADSRTMCLNRGADLVWIESQEENAWVVSTNGATWRWTGYNDHHIEGQWVWSKHGNYSSYLYLNPMKHKGGYGRDQCLHVYKYKGMWRRHVGRCNLSNRGVICKSKTAVPVQVNGGWSQFGPYSECSKTCGEGQKTRSRTCTNPTPANGGAQCNGLAVEIAVCNKGPCPVHGGWSEYGSFSKCRKTKIRTCTNPAPAHGGTNCVGPASYTVDCEEPKCPVNGGWSDFGAYSACSTTCGVGVKTQSRSCNNPTPAHGGANCQGPETRTANCNERPCPVANPDCGSLTFGYMRDPLSQFHFYQCVHNIPMRRPCGIGTCVPRSYINGGPWSPCSAHVQGGRCP